MVEPRSVFATHAVVSFLDSYESSLEQSGFQPEWINSVSAILIELLYVKLRKCRFATRPQYIGIDTTRPRFSIYRFEDGYVYGEYACDGESVCITSLTLDVPKILSECLRTFLNEQAA